MYFLADELHNQDKYVFLPGLLIASQEMLRCVFLINCDAMRCDFVSNFAIRFFCDCDIFLAIAMRFKKKYIYQFDQNMGINDA